MAPQAEQIKIPDSMRLERRHSLSGLLRFQVCGKFGHVATCHRGLSAAQPSERPNAKHVSESWVVREAVAEDEPCLVSMALKGYAHSREVKDAGLDSASLDGHPDEIRYWKIYQPIVTALVRGGSVKVACPHGRETYDDSPAVIAGFAVTTPGLVHWVGIKRSIMKIEGAGTELARDLLGDALEREMRVTFDLMDMRKIGLQPALWKRDRAWLSGLRSLSMRTLDRDNAFTSVGAYLLDARREEWRQNSERAA